MKAPTAGTESKQRGIAFIALVHRSGVDWKRFTDSIAPRPGVCVALVGLGGAVLPERVDGVDSVLTIGDGESLASTVNGYVEGLDSEFVCIVDAGGYLAPSAIDEIVEFAGGRPRTDLFYTDEADGDRGQVVAKPIHSPERLRCQFYFGDLLVYRRASFDSLGGLGTGLPGAELYDLALRASRAGLTIEYLPRPLYVRTTPPPPLDAIAQESTRTILAAHLDATGGGIVRAVGADGVHDTRRLVKGEPLVSIVIPSRGIYGEIDGERRCYLLDAVRSVLGRSTYTNVEFVVVLDSVADPAVISELDELLGSRLRVVPWTAPFNFSDKINSGAVAASGEYILMLNDDIEIISPDWIEALLALGQREGAGMVGAMLYYADETIQHAGHAYYEGDASHIGLDLPRGARGPLDGFRVEREVSGVTAACALMPSKVFRQVGGMSGLLPGAFNDVDLCMKVTWLGNEIYWTPHAELFHFESKTRDASVHEFEIDVAWGRWGFRMHDPRYWPYPHDRRPMNAGDLAW